MVFCKNSDAVWEIQTLTQYSVTEFSFIHWQINDGSCLSNMQCVLSPDADGYDQVQPI